jgi:hypothetical protein
LPSASPYKQPTQFYAGNVVVVVSGGVNSEAPQEMAKLAEKIVFAMPCHLL